MQLRDELAEVFGASLFERPLFYAYPGALRFELSEGRTWIGQFLTSLHKALSICSDIFAGSDRFVLCLRVRTGANAFGCRKLLQQLRDSQIPIPADRMFWVEPAEAEDWEDESDMANEVTLAFWVPTELIQSALWCALANDLGISPRIECAMYLINLENAVALYPYDDRGMDVVGPNKQALSALYCKHHAWLLSYDLAEMQAAYDAL